MKTTRLILALAAALSLGLAVFANVRTNVSTSSAFKPSSELVTEPSGADNAVTGVKVAWAGDGDEGDGSDCPHLNNHGAEATPA